VNLSETVEGTYLALPGRANHGWPHAVRHRYLNVNYIQFQHEVAQVPYRLGVKFYPSAVERVWAARERSNLGKGPVILWVISGSSVHKIWPYMDQVIARILVTYDNAKVVFAGGEAEKFIEGPWRGEARCHLKSGEWSIRETLAFALQCDLVIGPETGVLNAMALEKMPKVCLLSHSSHENLTRDWANAYAIYSKKTPCYPCHMLHYSFEYCPRGPETGTALCQEDIPADAVWAAVSHALSGEPMRRVEIVA
jgi:ADP-heptose:LPS heptosyltransferase